MPVACCCPSCVICSDRFLVTGTGTVSDINEGSSCGWSERHGIAYIVDSENHTHFGSLALGANTLVRCETEHTYGLASCIVTLSVIGTNGVQVGAVVNYTNDSNYHFSRLTIGPNGCLSLYERAAGVDTLLASVPCSTEPAEYISVRTYYDEVSGVFAAECNGSQVDVAVEVGTGTFDGGTKVGIRTDSMAGGQCGVGQFVFERYFEVGRSDYCRKFLPTCQIGRPDDFLRTAIGCGWYSDGATITSGQLVLPPNKTAVYLAPNSEDGAMTAEFDLTANANGDDLLVYVGLDTYLSGVGPTASGYFAHIHVGDDDLPSIELFKLTEGSPQQLNVCPEPPKCPLIAGETYHVTVCLSNNRLVCNIGGAGPYYIGCCSSVGNITIPSGVSYAGVQAAKAWTVYDNTDDLLIDNWNLTKAHHPNHNKCKNCGDCLGLCGSFAIEIDLGGDFAIFAGSPCLAPGEVCEGQQPPAGKYVLSNHSEYPGFSGCGSALGIPDYTCPTTGLPPFGFGAICMFYYYAGGDCLTTVQLEMASACCVAGPEGFPSWYLHIGYCDLRLIYETYINEGLPYVAPTTMRYRTAINFGTHDYGDITSQVPEFITITKLGDAGVNCHSTTSTSDPCLDSACALTCGDLEQEPCDEGGPHPFDNQCYLQCVSGTLSGHPFQAWIDNGVMGPDGQCPHAGFPQCNRCVAQDPSGEWVVDQLPFILSDSEVSCPSMYLGMTITGQCYPSVTEARWFLSTLCDPDTCDCIGDVTMAIDGEICASTVNNTMGNVGEVESGSCSSG